MPLTPIHIRRNNKSHLIEVTSDEYVTSRRIQTLLELGRPRQALNEYQLWVKASPTANAKARRLQVGEALEMPA